MKNAAKIRLIILCSILGLILLFFAFLGALYLYSNAVVFGHRDTSEVGSFLTDADALAADYPVNYPWFGNPLMLIGGTGRGFAIIFRDGGMKNIDVYMAVNDTIVTWIDYLSYRYDRRITLDYTMEQNSKTISVHFTGTAEDNGSIVPIDRSFIYNIENASPDNLPKWLNEDDMTDEYKEYINYRFNYETAPMPAWLEEKLAEE
ncbi:MAG: hypothetical protein J1F60_01765 [Oscillospiraceae bacterium]|nr:hypothetical protein [Oscillospiraceae bacterium]